MYANHLPSVSYLHVWIQTDFDHRHLHLGDACYQSCCGCSLPGLDNVDTQPMEFDGLTIHAQTGLFSGLARHVISTRACAGSLAASVPAAIGEDFGAPMGTLKGFMETKTDEVAAIQGSKSAGEQTHNFASETLPEPPVPQTKQAEEAAKLEIDEEPETPFPVPASCPQPVPDDDDQELPTPPLQEPDKKDKQGCEVGEDRKEETKIPSDLIESSPESSGANFSPTPENPKQHDDPPRVRMKKFLDEKKQARLAVEKVATEETSEAPATLSLPPKPADWGKHAAVSAEQQQPPKPRGRRKKADKAATTDANEAAPKAKAKSKVKSKKKSKQQDYEPLEVEGDINTDKGAAFDAYAAACAAADVYALKQ